MAILTEIDPVQLAAAKKRVLKKGDFQIIKDRADHNIWFVASDTTPGHIHRVEFSKVGGRVSVSCCCENEHVRKQTGKPYVCWHMVAAADALKAFLRGRQDGAVVLPQFQYCPCGKPAQTHGRCVACNLEEARKDLFG